MNLKDNKAYKVLKIEKDHFDLFCNISRDTNPLHVDENYASRTSFGKNVFYGIAGSLLAIESWLADIDQPIIIKELKINFHKPLYLNDNVMIQYNDIKEEKVVNLEIKSNAIIYTKIRIKYDQNDKAAKQVQNVQFKIEDKSYQLELSYFQSFINLFGKGLCHLNTEQLTLLCWTSYYVGMVNPGPQALFAQLQISFSDYLGQKINIDRVDDFPHLNAIKICGSSDSGLSFSIQAFNRPKQMEYDLKAITREIALPCFEMEGKHVVITGGARGLGGMLTRLFLYLGCEVSVVYRNDSNSIKTIREQIRNYRPNFVLNELQLDLAMDGAQGKFGYFLSSLKKPVDIFINNAAPSIIPKAFIDMNASTFLEVFLPFVKMTLSATYAVLPNLIKNCSKVVNISSVYVEKSPGSFSHYVAAKNAQEGIFKSLSEEMPDLKIYNIRVPTIKTDQTNTALSLGAMSSVDEIALEIYKQLNENVKSWNSIHLGK